MPTIKRRLMFRSIITEKQDGVGLFYKDER